MSQGVLYMATGEEFVSEVERSAASVAEHMPDVPIAIATDTPVDRDRFDHVIDYDFKTEEIDGRSWLLNSTIPPGLSPFDRTLFLDSDTLIRTDVSELFDLLDDYGLALARTTDLPPVDGLPDTWRQLNCGVIAYRESDAVTRLLEDWRERYRSSLDGQDLPVDQPTFARAVRDSNVRWFCLPPEYNVRPRRGAIRTEVKIIHGRRPHGIGAAADELDEVGGPRVFRERSRFGRPMFVVRNRGTFRYHAETVLSNYGFTSSLRIAADYLLDRLLGTNRMDRYREWNIG